MIRAGFLILLISLPMVAVAETISSVRHSQKPNGFRIVLDWADQIPSYELEPVTGGSVLWLKTVTRASAPFPEMINGWSGKAGYESGLYRVTFPASDGQVSVFSLAGSNGKEPRLVIDVVRGESDSQQQSVVQKKPITPLKNDVAPSKAALIGAASIRNMERFLDEVEQRVAAGEISAEEGYQLAQKHRAAMLNILKRELDSNQAASTGVDGQ